MYRTLVSGTLGLSMQYILKRLKRWFSNLEICDELYNRTRIVWFCSHTGTKHINMFKVVIRLYTRVYVLQKGTELLYTHHPYAIWLYLTYLCRQSFLHMLYSKCWRHYWNTHFNMEAKNKKRFWDTLWKKDLNDFVSIDDIRDQRHK